MKNSHEIAIAKKCIDLFMKQSNDVCCTPYSFKHIVERFTDLFETEHVYISTESGVEALGEMGYRIEDNSILAEWNYPDRETIISVLGNNHFETRFGKDEFKIPFYLIPNMRLKAMIEAYSSAYSRTGKNEFPMIDQFAYEALQWIDDKDGALSYFIGDEYITLDTIFTKKRRHGIGRKLFQLFLDEVSSYPDDFFIEIDAYTEDSKAFFKSLSKETNIFGPSRRLSKADTYSICIGKLK